MSEMKPNTLAIFSAFLDTKHECYAKFHSPCALPNWRRICEKTRWNQGTALPRSEVVLRHPIAAFALCDQPRVAFVKE